MSKELLIRGGLLLSPADGYLYKKQDIRIEGGKIVEIGEDLRVPEMADVITLDGEFVAPGFIDVHGHFDMDNPMHIGLHPDVAGVRLGNSAVIDAGSAGANNFENFYEKYIKHSTTRVYALLNLSCNGIDTWNELSSLGSLKVEEMKKMARKYPENILGIKVRSDGEATGDLGIQPFLMGQKAARDLGIPFVVHVGEYPPGISDMLALTEKGDLVTHCYNQYSPNGIYNSLIDEQGQVLDCVWEAKKKEVLFDVGHGGCSFSFQIGRAAFEQGFYPDIISTDIYAWNFLNPVWGLYHVMNKILHLGMDLAQCVACVTSTPADFFHMKGQGHLKEGNYGDITIFHLENTPVELIDSKNNVEVGDKKMVVDYVSIGGKMHRLI